MKQKVEVLDSDALSRATTRISFEIIEKNKGADNIVLMGIQRRGVVFAKRIASKIREIEGKVIPVGILDITFYRDDLSMLGEHPVINGTDIDFPVENKKIILVDDVLFTGRTIRAAIDAIFDLGRPKAVQLAIIVDRGHREIPFKADYVGKSIPTSKNEVVHVCVSELDGFEGAYISDKE